MRKRIKLLDGGLGTLLMNDEPDADNALWSAKLTLTHPKKVEAAHLAFLRMGCEYISTNTYQANCEGFKKEFNFGEMESVAAYKKAVELAKEARHSFMLENPSSNPKIVGSIGPYGASLCDGSEYTGNYLNDISEEFLVNWHKPKIDALIEGGVDLLAFETQPGIKEPRIMLAYIKRNFPNISSWISFSSTSPNCLSNGDKLVDAYSLFKDEAQVIALGLNCTQARFIAPHLRSISEQFQSVDKELIVYPNNCHRKENLGVHEYVDEWLNLGVRFIGGCCNVGLEDLKSIKEKVEKYNLTLQT